MPAIKVKRDYKKEWMFGLLGVAALGVLGVVSWLLWDNIQTKGWDQVQTIIVTSILSYLSWIWFVSKLVIDIFLYRKRFKLSTETPQISMVETHSKYLPKDTKKVSQNALNEKFKDFEKEFKYKDNFVKITKKEIVIVYGREFENSEDYYKSMSETLTKIANEIRQSKDKNTI